jgi:hypothetical protein
MLLFEEIVIEMVMIAAVVGSILCLAYLLQVTVRERAYLRRVERERREARAALVRWTWKARSAQGTPDLTGEGADTSSALREKRA